MNPPDRNPFRPTPGASPLVLAGRDTEIGFLLARLDEAPEIPADVRLTGSRGMGKTVLLKRFQEGAEERSWVTLPIDLDARFNYETELIALLTNSSVRKRETLSALVATRRRIGEVAGAVLRSVNLSVGDWTASLDPKFGEATVDLARPIVEVVETGIDAGKAGVLYAIDEAQFLKDDPESGEFTLSLLLSTFTQLQVARLPIALVLSGLPELDKVLGHTRPQTERLFRGLAIDTLDDAASTEALIGPLRGSKIAFDARVVELVLPEMAGYPHFIQVYGAELWAAAHNRGAKRVTQKLLGETLPAIRTRIRVDIYDFRMRQLSPSQRDLLIAASRLGPPPITVDQLSVSASPGEDPQAACDALVQLGVIVDRADRGEFTYTVPGFHDYLLNRADAWSSALPAARWDDWTLR
ncbi:MAG: ATP-binding protein [Chloroflexi bacterium]|nr:ATP-binding protein [Chloroflexota bacterium]